MEVGHNESAVKSDDVRHESQNKIGEFNKELLEDAKASGLYVALDPAWIVLGKHMEPLAKFAQLQAARNAEPVAWMAVDGDDPLEPISDALKKARPKGYMRWNIPLFRASLPSQDAERYRWLRYGDNDELVIQHGPVEPNYHWLPRNERLDAMIDKHLEAIANRKDGE